MVAPRPPAEGEPRARRRRADDEPERRSCERSPVDGAAPVDRGRADRVATPARRAAIAQGSRSTRGRRRREPEKPRDPRERKYVYVLEGILRGMAALERGSARPGAARLVNEFYKVARDVAFKHDALLDVPRLPADGNDVAVDELGDAGRDGRERRRCCASSSACRSRARTTPAARSSSRSRWSTRSTASARDVEPELRLALAVQRGVALVKPAARPAARTRAS